MLKWWLCAGALLLAVGASAKEAEPAAADPAIEARMVRIAAELRCLVCQNQNLKESHAPLALDLRLEVQEQIAAGKDDEAIKDYLVARYGDFVLYRPRFQPSTWLLWLAPAVLLLLGLFIALRILRRRPEVATRPDASALERVLNVSNNKGAPRISQEPRP